MSNHKNKSKKVNTSNKLKVTRRINRTIRHLKIKIARWNRNQLDFLKTKAGCSRNGWDTSGMQSHLVLLESLLKLKKETKNEN